MLLKISVKPENIIFNSEGLIIVKLDYYSEYSTAAHLATVEGYTKEDYDKNRAKKSKTLSVKRTGKISLE